MIINRQQLTALNQVIHSRFIDRLHQELVNAGIWSASALNHNTLARMVKDVTSAGITQENHIYKYCVLALEYDTLIEPPLPQWARNILFADAEPENKLVALERYLKENTPNQPTAKWN